MIKAIIWDIGGVLLENPKIGDFWKNRPGSRELRALFGSGKISKAEFLNKGSKMLNISKKEFLKKYAQAYFPIRLNNSTFKIYKNLKLKKYILSDTNPIHLNFIKNKYGAIFNISNGNFFSSEIGFRKDEINCFRYVLNKLGLRGNEVLIIDDREDILNISKKLGIHYILYNGPNSLVRELNNLGIS